MKPVWEEFQRLGSEVDERLLRAHYERLDADYFQSFTPAQVRGHLLALNKLSPENPVELLLDAQPEKPLQCTVLAFDYPFEFSLIAGILAGLGFSIESGGVHTYARVASAGAQSPRRPRRFVPPADDYLWRRRRIVDHFSGLVDSEQPLELWAAALRRELGTVFQWLETGGEAGRVSAKQHVNEMVAQRLAALPGGTAERLHPMEIEINNGLGPYTRLRVLSEDTPAFLYSFSNALSLQGVSIERIGIITVSGRVEDTLEVLNADGEKIMDPEALNRIRLSVLLTKQFTLFLGKSPDAFSALSRFENLVQDVLKLPESGRWVELLSSPKVLQDLAHLLGTSDFLWEDMIRQQYETLIPMLAPHVEGRRFAQPRETLPERLAQVMAQADSYEVQRERLNEFKDQEIFLIDLDHILTPGIDFKDLAEHLTFLAEQVVRQAVKAVEAHLHPRFGRPRTVAGWEAQLAIVGLGKFGGAALGYASDIELLFVYSDAGETDGPEPVGNQQFFEALVDEVRHFIRAKREGIFNLDLRLRPFGDDGPLACSLESFCNYFGPGGPAHALERLALVRLRAVGGDADLGRRVERLRDDFVYGTSDLNIKDLREMRLRQFEEKIQGGRLNAKFSPGGLVDLEYDVQILQVMFGKDNPALRTPRIHQALRALGGAGVLETQESEELIKAYGFLRELINALRMLRGSAKDLFLTAQASSEYLHLARRMGYEPTPEMDPARQLHVEFELRTATVRAFVERHFGRDSLPGPVCGSVADLILAKEVPTELCRGILNPLGFKDPERAYVNWRALAAAAGDSGTFARLAVLAADVLRRTPEPDMALNNWERFISRVGDPADQFRRLLAQPRRLEVLLSICAGSQFLADTLMRNPEFFEWATDPKNLRGIRQPAELDKELADLSRAHARENDWLNALRRLRRREILRIGTRDICLHAPLEEITLDLSILADALMQSVLSRLWQEAFAAGQVPTPDGEGFCVLALGKLGGQELNYSSDIDLLAVCADALNTRANAYIRLLDRVGQALSQHLAEGYAYRVDFRLRPYGGEGLLVQTVSTVAAYYREQAELPEVQALLKLRPLAGDLQLGQALVGQLRAVLLLPRLRSEIVAAVEKMRSGAMQQLAAGTDVKSGLGGLRDIEFMTQGLQLLEASAHPELLNGHTLQALHALAADGVLEADVVDRLSEDYVFLRRVEHYLQLLEDRQIHALPVQPAELEALGRRMLGVETSGAEFLDEVQMRLQRVREAYLKYFVNAV
ncbi:MAG: glutamate-ammonia-ligase adenylyltransferase [Candidatus Firestonebacteria bacterium]|nr:glutamate-ammonia-ligase adenylyltransferase [Candidatus Firestonebacteria bacterium]